MSLVGGEDFKVRVSPWSGCVLGTQPRAQPAVSARVCGAEGMEPALCQVGVLGSRIGWASSLLLGLDSSLCSETPKLIL